MSMFISQLQMTLFSNDWYWSWPYEQMRAYLKFCRQGRWISKKKNPFWFWFSLRSVRILRRSGLFSSFCFVWKEKSRYVNDLIWMYSNSIYFHLFFWADKIPYHKSIYIANKKKKIMNNIIAKIAIHHRHNCFHFFCLSPYYLNSTIAILSAERTLICIECSLGLYCYWHLWASCSVTESISDVVEDELFIVWSKLCIWASYRDGWCFSSGNLFQMSRLWLWDSVFNLEAVWMKKIYN